MTGTFLVPSLIVLFVMTSIGKIPPVLIRTGQKQMARESAYMGETLTKSRADKSSKSPDFMDFVENSFSHFLQFKKNK